MGSKIYNRIDPEMNSGLKIFEESVEKDHRLQRIKIFT